MLFADIFSITLPYFTPYYHVRSNLRVETGYRKTVFGKFETRKTLLGQPSSGVNFVINLRAAFAPKVLRQ